MEGQRIILASASPRRRELLSRVGIDFTVEAAKVDENIAACEPSEYVRILSERKARSVAERFLGATVIGADTVVVLGGTILGKPKDEEDAVRMLKNLSGREHKVYTGVTLARSDGKKLVSDSFFACTAVEMYENDEEVIRAYVATGEPMDKAGAYGIQGRGACLVKEIRGDYNSVVGLPVAQVWRRLRTF